MPDQESSAAQIDTWHRQRGWKFGIGYHYVIRRNGEIEPGRPEWMVGAHCVNHNSHSIGVCYEGGLDIRGQPADTRTEAQKASLRRLLEDLHHRYPHALIVGHHDLNPLKDCPCIPNVIDEFKALQPR
jgi:N-acetyl-anhydromuramyl-L-alanine amidase AmpD